MTYAKSIVLFNSRSNFVFKISLFRCNVNEISIILIIFIFLFYRENFQKRKIQSRNAYALTKFEPPFPCTYPYAFVMTPPSAFLPAYVLYVWPFIGWDVHFSSQIRFCGFWVSTWKTKVIGFENIFVIAHSQKLVLIS